jgi:hypothetical protein
MQQFIPVMKQRAQQRGRMYSPGLADRSRIDTQQCARVETQRNATKRNARTPPRGSVGCRRGYHSATALPSTVAKRCCDGLPETHRRAQTQLQSASTARPPQWRSGHCDSLRRW